MNDKKRLLNLKATTAVYNNHTFSGKARPNTTSIFHSRSVVTNTQNKILHTKPHPSPLSLFKTGKTRAQTLLTLSLSHHLHERTQQRTALIFEQLKDKRKH